MARETGLEPATSAVTGRRSSHDFNGRFDSGAEKNGSKACDSTPESKQEKPKKKPKNGAAYAYDDAPLGITEPPITVGNDPLLAALAGGRR